MGSKGSPNTVGTESLNQLIKESEESLRRLDALSKGKNESWTKRLSGHLSRHSNSFINIALAGSVFIIALARLNEKYSYQAEKDLLEEEKNSLQLENNELMQHLRSAHEFASSVETAVSTGGRHLSPHLQQALADFRQCRSAIEEIITSSEAS